MLGRVRFKYDHEAIRQELEEHIDDLTEELKDEGLESGDALTSAILHMGDPEEIGREMDKAHSPALGHGMAHTQIRRGGYDSIDGHISRRGNIRTGSKS